jgi:hypothetical protein
MSERRITPFVLVICWLCIAAFGQENRHQLSPAERQHILDGEFKVISTTDGIPTKVEQAFTEITREPSFALANPGQKYQAGDVVVDRSLPRRRLVFAGVSDNKWFMHYERGGRGVGYYVVVFRADPHGNAHFVWGGSGTNRAKSLEQLRKMIAAGQFSDAANY